MTRSGHLEYLLIAFYSWHSPGVQYVAFYPGSLNGPLSITLPSSIASVPVFSSQLSDHMNLWERAQNLFYSFMAPVGRSVFFTWDHRLFIWLCLNCLEIVSISYERSETRVVDVCGSRWTPPRVSPWWPERSTRRSWALGIQHRLFTRVPPASSAFHCLGRGSAEPARQASRTGLWTLYTST